MASNGFHVVRCCAARNNYLDCRQQLKEPTVPLLPYGATTSIPMNHLLYINATKLSVAGETKTSTVYRQLPNYLHAAHQLVPSSWQAIRQKYPHQTKPQEVSTVHRFSAYITYAYVTNATVGRQLRCLKTPLWHWFHGHAALVRQGTYILHRARRT